MANDNTQEPVLFDDEAYHDAAEENRPVTCLGMTFENDDARREYFRAELRRRLPELRQIEGFPIGEDDDIIALSDPPYYTACPNPWLNDFVHQWEDEKQQLEAEGKRSKDFEVTEPYASDVSEGKNNPVYNIHTYHTKVPHPAIMRYILHYTQPGDIVFDGFCGTGMTGVAATLCDSDRDVTALNLKEVVVGRRHAICSDLSPIASFIASVLNTPHDIKNFSTAANKILSELRQQYGWMYKTKHENDSYGEIISVVWSDVFVCPNCGEEIIFYDAALKGQSKVSKEIFCPACNACFNKKDLRHAYSTSYNVYLDKSVASPKSIPVLIKYRYGNNTYYKKPDADDIKKITDIESSCAPFWIPTQEIPNGNKTREVLKNGISHVFQFYTHRNLYILAALYDKIRDNQLLLLWFTSQLINLSKLNRYRPEVSFPYNPFNGTYYVSSLVCESNVFDAYKNKIERFIKGLKDLNKQHNVSSVASAAHLSVLADNSIDYIFVDPPFGENLMYSELNLVWEHWLKVATNDNDEAIINRFKQKDLFDYQTLMCNSFMEFYRVLKPNRWMTIEFSNTSASVWNSIQNALQRVGFVVSNVSSLDKQLGSYNAVTSTTAVKQDLVITCYKPTAELTEKMQRSGDTAENVWDFVGELLLHLPVHLQRENKTTAVVERSPKILFDRMIAYYVQHGYPVPMDAQEFQQGLKERFVERDGMYFTADQAIEYDEKKRNAPEMAELSFFVDSEQNGIAWLRRELTDRPQTYQDLQPKWMQALASTKKGDRLPEMMELLEDNFIKEEDGTWRTPNPEKEADLEKLRTKKLLREFDHYAEQALLPKSKTMKEVRLEALRAGFKQCYKDKDFHKIIAVAEKIPETLLTEDEVLLQYYDIATARM